MQQVNSKISVLLFWTLLSITIILINGILSKNGLHYTRPTTAQTPFPNKICIFQALKVNTTMHWEKLWSGNMKCHLFKKLKALIISIPLISRISTRRMVWLRNRFPLIFNTISYMPVLIKLFLKMLWHSLQCLDSQLLFI